MLLLLLFFPPVIMYGCEIWTIKKAEHRRTDASELNTIQKRVPWTVGDQLILKEFNPECSLEGLVLKLNLQYFGHLMLRADSLEKNLMLGKTEDKRRGWQSMGWLDGITDSMDIIWASSGRWWRTGNPGLLHPLGRKESDWQQQHGWDPLWGVSDSSHILCAPKHIGFYTGKTSPLSWLQCWLLIGGLWEAQHLLLKNAHRLACSQSRLDRVDSKLCKWLVNLSLLPRAVLNWPCKLFPFTHRLHIPKAPTVLLFHVATLHLCEGCSDQGDSLAVRHRLITLEAASEQGGSESVSCIIVSDSLWSHGTRKSPLSMEFCRQEYWSGLPFPFPRDLPHPGIKPRTLALQANSLPYEPKGEVCHYWHSQRQCIRSSHILSVTELP